MLRACSGIAQYEKHCRIQKKSAHQYSGKSKSGHPSYRLKAVHKAVFCKRHKEHQPDIQHRHKRDHVEEIEVRQSRKAYREYEQPRLSLINHMLRTEEDQRKEYHRCQEERMPYRVVHRKSAERISKG